MSTFIMSILAGLPLLGILIFVHELGHFLVAKYYKVGVLEFAIGFGKKIWQKRIGETRYTLRAIPLGGYVRMVGDDPIEVYGEEAEETEKSEKRFNLEGLEEDFDEQDRALMADRSRWFLERGFWPKAAIVFAGPLFNILFAWVLAMAACAIYGVADLKETAEIGAMDPEGPASKAGLLEGDLVLKIDETEISDWRGMARVIRASEGATLSFLIERDGSDFTIEATPELEAEELALLYGDGETRNYRIGITPASVIRSASLSEVFQLGTYRVWSMSYITVRSLVLMFGGSISANNVSGPIEIVKTAGRFAEEGLDKLFYLAILLSISLAIINLLPIPILDGGHLMFFVIEAIKGAPVSMRVRDLANQVGMLLILGLMVFAIGNDLVKLVT